MSRRDLLNVYFIIEPIILLIIIVIIYKTKGLHYRGSLLFQIYFTTPNRINQIIYYLQSLEMVQENMGPLPSYPRVIIA